jgi:arabinan endo-1,5-alpha-L-arabinosidase
MDPMVGGTPVLVMSGNRWLGPGHNAVVTDMAGQDWMLYHAVDGLNPLINNSETRRPALLDRLDWSDGWPTVRSGVGASDSLETTPAMSSSSPMTNDPPVAQETMGALISGYSDDFTNKYSAHWSWTDGAAQGTFGLQRAGGLQFATQAGELADGQHSAPLFTESAPSGDFVAEVKLHSTLPESGVHNSVESGLVFYQDDSHYLKLVQRALGETRQLEFSRQDGAVWGSSYMAAAAGEQWLRLARHGEVFTAYSSRDGVTWTRGPSWMLDATASAKLGLISAGGTGYATDFSYIKVGERQ